MSPLRGRKVPIRLNSSLLVKSPRGRYRRRPTQFYASYSAKTRTEASPVPGLSPCTRQEPAYFRTFHTFGNGKWKNGSRNRRYLSVTLPKSLIIEGTSPLRIKTAKDVDIREFLPCGKAEKRVFPSIRRICPRPKSSNFAPQLHLLSADSDKDLSAWS